MGILWKVWQSRGKYMRGKTLIHLQFRTLDIIPKYIYIMEEIYAQYEYKLIFYHKIKIMKMLNFHIFMFIHQETPEYFILKCFRHRSY